MPDPVFQRIFTPFGGDYSTYGQTTPGAFQREHNFFRDPSPPDLPPGTEPVGVLAGTDPGPVPTIEDVSGGGGALSAGPTGTAPGTGFDVAGAFSGVTDTVAGFVSDPLASISEMNAFDIASFAPGVFGVGASMANPETSTTEAIGKGVGALAGAALAGPLAPAVAILGFIGGKMANALFGEELTEEEQFNEEEFGQASVTAAEVSAFADLAADMGLSSGQAKAAGFSVGPGLFGGYGLTGPAMGHAGEMAGLFGGIGTSSGPGTGSGSGTGPGPGGTAGDAPGGASGTPGGEDPDDPDTSEDVGGDGAGAGAGAGSGAAGAGDCFVEGTLVLMGDGTRKPIQDIEVGDDVMAVKGSVRGGWLGKPEPKPVINVKVGKEPIIWFNKHIGCSPLEWLARADGSVARARDFKVGDALLSSAGSPVSIKHMDVSDVWQTVFNFDVDDAHSYFANGILTVRGIGVRGANINKPSPYLTMQDAWQVVREGYGDQNTAR